MISDSFIHMGTLTRPHGLKGEVCVDWFGESPSLLQGIFYLQAGENTPYQGKSASMRMHKGQPLLRLEHVDDRTAAEALRGLKVLLHEDDLPELDDDEVYLHTIIGLAVVLDSSGEHLGVLDHVEFPAGQELWSIITPEGKEILLPAVEDFIRAFEVEEGRIRVSPPEGLLEIYLQEDSKANATSGQG